MIKYRSFGWFWAIREPHSHGFGEVTDLWILFNWKHAHAIYKTCQEGPDFTIHIFSNDLVFDMFQAHPNALWIVSISILTAHCSKLSKTIWGALFCGPPCLYLNPMKKKKSNWINVIGASERRSFEYVYFLPEPYVVLIFHYILTVCTLYTTISAIN